MERPIFNNKLDEIQWIHTNKSLLIAEKQNSLKHSDVTLFKSEQLDNTTATTNKADMNGGNQMELPKEMELKLVINACNIIDSHMDCHINGIWNKSVKENKQFFLLQEHEMEFDMVIADSINDKLVASVKNIDWKALKMPYTGKTECLVFDATIQSERNEFMFKQYRKGYVLNHSVGMRYVKLFLCIDSEDAIYASEKANWDKYYPSVMNKDVADEKGYFWAVTEAKFIEGSAVVKGSNIATPMLEIEEKQDIEAVQDTSKGEPSKDTQAKQFFINQLK